MIRVYMLFSGSGPILLVTKSNAGMDTPSARTYLANKGIVKYIAFEVSSDHAKERYGVRFNSTAGSLTSNDDIRVLDIDGHHVFKSFSFKEMGEPVYVGDE